MMKRKTKMNYQRPDLSLAGLDLETLICGSFRTAPTVDELDNRNVDATESYLENYIEF